ncbi:ArsR/SmtB family transcription factor [Georgenia sp. Z1344]|uniref:ArsR/SmtB family transcription factor n=1 Tax=Georgenia sp. Z1344 TaxID=3416706 RepID=UPI003CE96F36
MAMKEEGPTTTSATGAHALLFHALAEPARLALLDHLTTGEHRVRDLVDHMHLAQSTVSKHLACLRDCGLVTVRAEGRASWFAIADPERLADLRARADALLVAAGIAPGAVQHSHDDEAAPSPDDIVAPSSDDDAGTAERGRGSAGAAS